MAEHVMERNEWLEARYLGSVAVMLRERQLRIETQLAALQLELKRVQIEAQEADKALDAFGQTLSAKYGLQDGDTINFETGQIITQEAHTNISPHDSTAEDIRCSTASNAKVTPIT